MKNLQKKGWLKALAWFMVVVCAFGAAFTAGLGLTFYEYSHYRYGGYYIAYNEEVQYYQDMAWQAFELMQDPGETEQERQKNQKYLEDLQGELEGSGFYFEIRNVDTNEVLLSNLTDDSQKELLESEPYVEEPKTSVEEGAPEGTTSAGEEMISSVPNPVCYSMDGDVLLPIYTYTSGSGSEDGSYEADGELYVEGYDGWLYPVVDVSNSDGSYTANYQDGWCVDPYGYLVQLESDGSNCYMLQMNGQYLSTPLNASNEQIIRDSIEAGSVFVKVGENYYPVLGQSNDGLIYQIPYDEFINGIPAEDTPMPQEGAEHQMEISDLAAVYFRLKEDGTLEYLNLLRSDDIQGALNGETLYVLTGEKELCRVVSRINGDVCVYDTADEITAELTVESGGTVGADCYQRTEEGLLEPVETTDMITLLNLCYGSRLYILNDQGQPVRVTSCAQQEDGIYYGYQNYADATVVKEPASEESLPTEMPDQQTEQEAPARYYMAYGVGPVAGVTTVFDELDNECAQVRRNLPEIIAASIAFGVADLLAVVWLCIASGHRKGKEGITLNWFDRIWLDLLLVCYFFAGLAALAAGDAILRRNELSYSGSISLGYLTRMGIASAFCVLLEVGLLWLLLTVIARIKAETLFKNFLVVRIIKWLWRKISGPFRKLRLKSRLKRGWEMMQKNLKLAVKVLLAFGVYAVIDFICAAQYGMSIGICILWLLLHLAALIVLEYWCLNFDSIRKGVARLNQGEMEAQINTQGMPYDLRAVAEQLNNLSEGINRAVEKQMQSERFKAELITNVSHDLKTPLTSIINYVDLLKQTNITDPKALEYLEVLDRKSQRLKKLTEDLVEASKASTGAIKVEKTVLDFGQLVTQALGEYDEKLQSARLKTVYQPPEEPMVVLGDGRHLWRVLDNLLNNCVKYAMPGTRVYLSLNRSEDGVILEMKNISAEPLNLTAAELMERFVRGDSSRSSEGSGLGLNIAMNLIELQGGTFSLSIDGDLFKAIVTIPKA